MKKLFYSIAVILSFAVVSCQEWEPVLGNQGEPAEPAPQTQPVNTTIAQLKAMYTGKPVHIDEDIIIGGKIITSDLSGNIYRLQKWY